MSATGTDPVIFSTKDYNRACRLAEDIQEVANMPTEAFQEDYGMADTPQNRLDVIAGHTVLLLECLGA